MLKLLNKRPKRINWKDKKNVELVLKKTKQGVTNTEIAKIFGMSRESMAAAKTMLRRRGVKIPYQVNEPDNIENIEYTDYWKLGGDWMVCGDLHVPFHDIYMLNRLVDIARRHKITNLLIAGNLFDQKSVSIWETEDKMLLEKEFSIGEDLLVTLLQTFKNIKILFVRCHDKRALKLMKFQVTVSRFARMFSKNIDRQIECSKYAYCIVDDRFRITHPKNITERCSTNPRKLAMKYDINIIAFHGHISGMEFTPNGKYFGKSCAGMTSPEKHEYASLVDSTWPAWIKEFCMIRNKHAYFFDNVTTDWNFWLGRKR